MIWNPFRREAAEYHPIDIDAVVREGRRDPNAARAALKTLQTERRNLDRRAKWVRKQYRDQTVGRYKTISRSRGTSPAMNELLYAQAASEANDPSALTERRDAELTALDERRQAIADAISTLHATTTAR